MAVKSILKMGDVRLLQRATEVPIDKIPNLSPLLSNMFDSMDAAGGVGLAAPQIGVLLRVVIFGGDPVDRYPDQDAVPKTVLINPSIEILGDELASDWEGCLSVPGMRGLVPRATHIRYRGYDSQGCIIHRQAKDFHARVVQHECDHLDGVLYPMRIEDMRHFGFEDALSSITMPNASST